MKHNYFFLLIALLFGLQNIVVQAQSTHIFGPPGSRQFGTTVTVLSNGNFVVTDPAFDDGALQNVGAVYLYNGSTLELISTLNGSKPNDQVGSKGVTSLANGNFVVSSPNWDDGAKTDVGAVTWGNGTTGVSGTVQVANSLVGSTAGDQIGSSGVTGLSNGHYVVRSPFWDNGPAINAGAVTWGNGTKGLSGLVSETNSLVGTNPGDAVGSNLTVLNQGNCVVNSPGWDNGPIVDAGAVTWCNGNKGFSGSVSNGNSLVGTTQSDQIGNRPVTAMSNGNYIVNSPNWNNGLATNAGAVTWGNGVTGISGSVSSINSLVGSTTNDQIGNSGVTTLNNGNYVINSPNWDDDSKIDVGAVTWGHGTTGVKGIVNAVNSLVGNTSNDQIGHYSGATALSNSNYVVNSPSWDNGPIVDAGAVTLCNGNIGSSGTVGIVNSLVGNTANDQIGNRPLTALSNGNYVVNSPGWNNGTGAVTWGNGTSGISGLVSSVNSLLGSPENGPIGNTVTALSNGNYVVGSPFWNNAAGAATWCTGTMATTGTVSNTNSLTGTWGDYVGNKITALSNGNYVVRSSWFTDTFAFGAVTLGNGVTGVKGAVSGANSLVGSIAGDYVGYPDIIALDNGNYLVWSKYWNNGEIADAGAITWGSGSTGVSGFINASNSVMGAMTGFGEYLLPIFNETFDYLLVAKPRENRITKFLAGNCIGLAFSLDSVSLNIHGNAEVPVIASTSCRIIATLKPNGSQPVAGTVNAKLWIEATVPTYQGKPFVARHYEITPITLPSTSTGRVTLYFTQQEFTNYNNEAGSDYDLPTSPDDATGISNIRIGKFAGTSSDRSGLPASYPGDATFQDPDDIDIIWNEELLCWAISFNVTGFSGFIVRAEQSALPLNLLAFNGRLLNSDALLNWKTSQEENTAGFRIERSFDGKDFLDLGYVKAKNTTGLHSYNYTDPNIIALNQRVVYYRLKIMDTDSRFRYSEIIALAANHSFNSLIIYPNPVLDAVNFSVTLTEPQQVQARIMDNAGRVVKQQQWNLGKGSTSLTLDLGSLSNAIYYLELKGKTIHERKLFIKQ